MCAYIDKGKQGKGCCRRSWRRQQGSTVTLTRGSLPWLPKRLSAYLQRACVLLARGVARAVMLLRLSLSTACTSLVLGIPLLRTGARASHHHPSQCETGHTCYLLPTDFECANVAVALVVT